MRRAVLALVLPAALLCGGISAEAAVNAAAAKPQVTDPGGDSLLTKHQDIKSVEFRTKGKPGSQALVVTMSTWSPVMADLATFNYEVDARASCGTVSFTMSPNSAYAKAISLNGWYETTCGAGVNDLTVAEVRGNTITWTMPLDKKAFPRGTTFTDFEARIDLAQPVLPFPSSLTFTALGLIDSASSKTVWRLP